jgi:hypothetical protein
MMIPGKHFLMIVVAAAFTAALNQQSYTRDSTANNPAMWALAGGAVMDALAVKRIEFYDCHYVAGCTIHICLARATTIARYIDGNGRPVGRYELCAEHTDRLARRESVRDWHIVNLTMKSWESSRKPVVR